MSDGHLFVRRRLGLFKLSHRRYHLRHGPLHVRSCLRYLHAWLRWDWGKLHNLCDEHLLLGCGRLELRTLPNEQLLGRGRHELHLQCGLRELHWLRRSSDLHDCDAHATAHTDLVALRLAVAY